MNKKGVTLIELIVVMAIVAIISGGAVVSFSLVDSRRLKAETNTLLADLWWAGEMATAKRKDYIVNFDTSNNRYSITDGTGNMVRPFRNLGVDLNTAPDTMTFYAPRGFSEIDPATASEVILLQGSREERLLLGSSDSTGWGSGPTGEGAGYARRKIFHPSYGWCFIATATYCYEENCNCRQLQILRKFRDDYLLTNKVGRDFVELYYEFSPDIADYIRRQEWAKKTAKAILDPVVWFCRKITGE
ncbi:MAG: prepilin-type N-terminal cleavage/methylation domain-containing protein [Candidatus Omnitrophica bacterium]|nr:prepilin-type N-terminal cleavage/methylation domain-containing protein [Candidatus Omnitrophota bacterium]